MAKVNYLGENPKWFQENMGKGGSMIYWPRPGQAETISSDKQGKEPAKQKKTSDSP